LRPRTDPRPDAIEYLDIARRLAAGDGFMLGIKAFHFGGTMSSTTAWQSARRSSQR